MNYRQVADHVKQRQRLKLQQMSKPDDDWLPEAYFLGPEGQLAREPLPPFLFTNRRTKAAMVNDAIVPLIRMSGTRVVALVVVMFMLSSEHPMGQVISEREQAGDPSPTRGLPYFQDVEGSIEQLWVNVFDAERHEGWAATITRPDHGRPKLGPFVLVGPDEAGGDLIDPIKAALR